MHDTSDRSSITTETAQQRRTFVLIRYSLFLGTLMFGVAVFVMHRLEGPPIVADPRDHYPMAIAAALLALGALPVTLAIRSRRRRARLATDFHNLTFVGIGVSAATALFGGVVYMLAGQPIPYIVGVAVLIATMVLLPPDPSRPE